MHNLRNLRWTFVVALFSYVAILYGNWLLVHKPSQDIQQSWLVQSGHIKQQSVFIGQLAKEFGYSGFIHHFKNYVLRRDDAYLQSANRSLIETQSLIAALTELTDDETQLKNLNALHQVANRYGEKVAWIYQNSALVAQLDTVSLDQQLLVNDSVAALAMAALFEQNKAMINAAALNSQHHYRQLAIKSLVWLVTLSLLYWVTVGYLLQRNRKIRVYSQYLTAINDLSPAAMVMTDSRGQILSANLKFKNMFAVTADNDLSAMTIEEFLPIKYRKKHLKDRSEFMQSQRKSAMKDRQTEFFGQRLNGEVFPAEISIASLGDQPNRQVIAIIQDKSHEVFLAEQANTDYLTQTSNRKFAEEHLETELYRFQRYGEPLCVMLIDIDNFKEINDTHGHSLGDHVLISVVKIIEQNLRRTDILARWGGDEFIAILPSTPQSQAKTLAKKLISLTENNFAKTRIPVTLSIGLASAKPDQTAKALINTADAALYISKGNGRNQVSVLKVDED